MFLTEPVVSIIQLCLEMTICLSIFIAICKAQKKRGKKGNKKGEASALSSASEAKAQRQNSSRVQTSSEIATTDRRTDTIQEPLLDRQSNGG